MNFTCNTKELLKAIQFVARVVPSNAIVPAWECVLFKIRKDGVMSITASDSNTTLRIKSKATEVEMGSADTVILAPADLLIKALTSLPNGPVTFTYTEEGNFNFSMELSFESDLYRIPCEDPTTYFRVPEVKDGESLVIPAQKLKKGIEQVVKFVSEDQLRPQLCGISMRIFPGCLEFISTDGFTFSYYSRQHDTSASEKEFIIPAKFSKILSDSIGDIEKDINMDVAGNMVKLHFGDWQAYSVLIEGVHPGKRELIPQQAEFEATVDADTLRTAIKRANIFANFKEPEIDLTFKGSNLFLESGFEEKNTRSNQDISIQSEIDDLSISFNARRLSEALSIISGPFTIEMNATHRPAVIKPEKEDDEDIAIMVFPVVPATV